MPRIQRLERPAQSSGLRWDVGQCSNNEANRGPTESNKRLSSPVNEAAKTPKMQRLKAVWPEVWKLMRPRRGLLAFGFLLMIINKLAGFVLPYSSKFLIDNVVSKGQTGLLRPLVLWVLLATVIQGVTSFSLTQLLSKAAQRLIADRRPGVTHHERCGGRPQSAGHGPGRFCGRIGRGGHCAGVAAAHQCTAYADSR